MRGFNISGEIIVYKNEYGYYTTIRNKNIEGNYDKMYVTIQLPKGQELENKSVIIIEKGFLSFYKDKNGLPKVKAVIREFDIIGIDDLEVNENYSDNELPF